MSKSVTDVYKNAQLSYLNGGSWKSFNNITRNAMDGIKIQTKSSEYYLMYRTWNQGKTDYYPYVSSKEDDYAGASGKPIQQIQIQAYRKDGTKLSSGIVVMYRAYVDNSWLPWVSNADPEWMYSVSKEYALGGSLDTASSYAGKPGKNIQGIQILVFEAGSLGNFTGGENTTSALSYMLDDGSKWYGFDRAAVASHIDGIKIQTAANKDYYLTYQTWNEGKTAFYPVVTSRENDYAGSPGKPIQKITISAFKNDGTKLTSGVIVMYRVRVEDRWLPWVSNADPEWMQNMKSKYSLDGSLDTSSGYAGIDGKNIQGVEIRILEEDSSNAGGGSFTGGETGAGLSCMTDGSSAWKSFTGSITASHIDGVKMQTGSDKAYYLAYETWNEGQSYYYPTVTSKENDYAGSVGKPIQRLSIRAYANDGTKLTTGIVVLYRVRVENRWLPWVSNADPEWMDSVKSKYNLDGELDYSSAYAGIGGKNINGVEIRVFDGKTTASSIGGLAGNEVSAPLSYLNGSTWKEFTGMVLSKMDGIKIQTTGKPYYLQYRTWNSGKSGYYPFVTSTENDYAGSPGKPVQLLNIQVYKTDGTKLTSGVVVMYRTYTDGRWLPWVSNADPEWMQTVQTKYKLDGALDTQSYYAGIDGKDISGVEIRIFEENQMYTGEPTPTGKYKLISAPFISQIPSYPTGCESVSTVMALKYAGINISVDKFIDSYLYKTSLPFDPNVSFGGNPRSDSSYGCYAPVIKKALDKALTGTSHYAKTVSGLSMQNLCSQYIDKGIPVIIWATMGMRAHYISAAWTYGGKTIRWVAPEHCLLLVGYDDNHYIFNDPLRNSPRTYYTKTAVEEAYQGLSRQAIVVMGNSSTPNVPVTNVTLNKTSANLVMGEEITLSANVVPSNATNKVLTWYSSDSSIVDVNSVGKIVATKAGTATITVTIEGKSASCKISVSSLCGGSNYRNVNHHDMEINQSDGYYHCKKCGYKVKSPALQDKSVLNKSDYLTVAALYHEYLVQVEPSPRRAESILYAIDEIRSLPENSTKYEYQGAGGKYQKEYTAANDANFIVNVSQGDCVAEWNVMNILYPIISFLAPPPYSYMLSIVGDLLAQEHPGATDVSGTEILMTYGNSLLGDLTPKSEKYLKIKKISAAVDILFSIKTLFEGPTCTENDYTVNLTILSEDLDENYSVRYHFAAGVESLSRGNVYDGFPGHSNLKRFAYNDEVNKREYDIS
ncbi:C39 family peptidase [Scatolibacter rhodanostii]|uniref:C39 family peptidase n=1 Tax=Scatolibacter rhodanostii TaxID=2014781 RepID=UPI0013564326|nr:C39 family peptidase [Scatolibacter rhodanostii]